jgi:hypothetical protein
MYRSKTLTMKNHTLILLASLAVLASSVSAASNQTEPDMVVLPTYVVTAPRYLPAEQQINASLMEFTKQALTPLTIAPDMSALKAQSASHQQLAEAARTTKAAHVAKS